MATLQSPGEQNPLDDSMGVMFIGVIASAVLYGVSLAQTLYYFNRYPNDAWYLKYLTLRSGYSHFAIRHQSSGHDYAYHLSLHNHRILRPSSTDTAYMAEALPTGITGTLVQFFYVVRIFRREFFVLGASIRQLDEEATNAACGTGLSFLSAPVEICPDELPTHLKLGSLQMETYHQLLKINPLTITINALSAAADVLIAAILCYLLARSKTGFKRSDSMISKLITFTANTGL
ncbi:hypothetical protein PQX77_005831 [Marasmius sp. AFHP31]|nr:hypothetical protein PQX77_005831 [Marasmius sp. AFHP31]